MRTNEENVNPLQDVERTAADRLKTFNAYMRTAIWDAYHRGHDAGYRARMREEEGRDDS